MFDAHCHVMPDAYPGEAGAGDRADCRVATLLACLDEAGFRGAAVMPMPIQAALELNPWILSVARKHPSRLVPGVLLDDRVEVWAASGARFVKEHIYGMRTKKRWAQNRPALETCERYQLPLLAHFGGDAGGTAFEHFEAVAHRVLEYREWCPGLRIVVGHAGMRFPTTGWVPEWARLLGCIAKLEDVFVDISCIQDGQVLRTVVGEMDVERILFGSDFPYESPARALKRLCTIDLAENSLAAILEGNARRLFDGA